jgi:hypothetical protein
MGQAVGVAIGLVLLGLLGWAQVGMLFERRYRRDDPGTSGKHRHGRHE